MNTRKRNEITGYSRYTRKSQLIQYVEGTLLETFIDEDLPETQRSESSSQGDRTESSPVAIASGEINPEGPRSTQINPDQSQVPSLPSKTDQYESSLSIPELSRSHPKRSPGSSPGHPSVMPKLCLDHPLVMPELSPGHNPVMPNSGPGHARGMIDRYPQNPPQISGSSTEIKPRLTPRAKVPSLFKNRFKSSYWIAFGRIWAGINGLKPLTRGRVHIQFALLWNCAPAIGLEGGC